MHRQIRITSCEVSIKLFSVFKNWSMIVLPYRGKRIISGLCWGVNWEMKWPKCTWTTLEGRVVEEI